MKRVFSFCAAMLMLAVCSGSSVPAAAASAEARDAVTMYLVKHAARIHVQHGAVILDDASLGNRRVHIRNGRVFIPVRLLQDLGIGSVEWDAGKREVKVTAAPELRAPVQTLVFHVGNERLYDESGAAFPDIVSEAPFLERNRVYVPVQHLALLGVAVEYEKPHLNLKWSDKRFEIHTPAIKAGDGEVRFTVLYETGLEAPSALTALNGSAWTGSSDHRKIVGRDIVKDGKTFTRMEFALPLRPGPNPIMLSSSTFGQTVLETYWRPETEEEVPLSVFEVWPVKFEEPRYGYVTAGEGEPVVVSGTVSLEGELSDHHMTLQLERYDPVHKVFVQAGEDVRIPIVNNRFSGSFPAPEPGTYLVNVYSPRYIPHIDGSVAVKWAEFVLEVRSDRG